MRDLPATGSAGSVDATRRQHRALAAGAHRRSRRLLQDDAAPAHRRRRPRLRHPVHRLRWRLAPGLRDADPDGDGHDGHAADDITFDRVYVHGHRYKGQKRGIALNGRAISVLNSYISDIKAIHADSQAINGYNGAGPFTIENNYIEARART